MYEHYFIQEQNMAYKRVKWKYELISELSRRLMKLQ